MSEGPHARPANREASPRGKRRRGCVIIDPSRCKGCNFCVEFCPTHVLRLSTRFNAKGYHYPEIVETAECTGCDICGMVCPDFAIFGRRI